MNGFVANRNDLTDIANKLRGAARQLGDTASSAPPSPDAGSSSALVSQVISDLMRTGATAAAVLDRAAGNVHAAQGSYDTTDNDAAAAMQAQDNKGLSGIDMQSNASSYPG
jgi:hypothetical protein